MQNAKEIVILRQMIEESVGRKIASPTDFSFLTGVIAERCHETLGITTLKRIWGYVEGYDTMRHSEAAGGLAEVYGARAAERRRED